MKKLLLSLIVSLNLFTKLNSFTIESINNQLKPKIGITLAIVSILYGFYKEQPIEFTKSGDELCDELKQEVIETKWKKSLKAIKVATRKLLKFRDILRAKEILNKNQEEAEKVNLHNKKIGSFAKISGLAILFLTYYLNK